MSASPSLLPRDARLIALLLAANGVTDSDDGVVRMLVEFAHRYTADILTDSLLYAEHARSGATFTQLQNITPGLEDVRLAVQTRTEGASVPKEFLLQLATTVNAVPLPAVPEVYGVRLPPAAARLTAPNFSIVPRSVRPLPSTTERGGGEGNGTNGNANANGNGNGMMNAPEAEEESDEGLFGDDIEGEDDDEEEDEEDDEEMEDLTNGIPGGRQSGGSGSGSGAEGGEREGTRGLQR